MTEIVAGSLVIVTLIPRLLHTVPMDTLPVQEHTSFKEMKAQTGTMPSMQVAAGPGIDFGSRFGTVMLVQMISSPLGSMCI